MKKIMKMLQRALVRSVMYFFFWLFSWLPRRLVWAITDIVLKIGFVFMIRQRQIAEETIDQAFSGDKTLEQRRKIILECFEGLGRGGVEMMLALSRRNYVNTIVKVENEERLKEALAKGCGVIAVTAHFGNFPLMMLYLARRGYAASCIIRPARDEKMEEFLKAKRTEQELKTIYAIPRHACVVQSLKVLRQNEVLFIPVDQNMGAKGGVFVNFFGREASTPTGPVVFARRSGAVILPMFMVREPGDTHRIIIEKPLELVEGKDEVETLRINMQNMTEVVERYIRLYPGQWAWMHRRWKTQPDTNQAVSAEEVL